MQYCNITFSLHVWWVARKLLTLLAETYNISYMKNLLLILFTIIPLCACAQKYSARRNQDAAALRAQAHARDSLMQTLQITAAGAYEKEEVVYIDSVPAKVLFTRAMETPNDLPVTKVELDSSNKESSAVIYKGEFSLGFNHVGLGDGWIRHGDFSLKVLCEDGRAQIILTVPDIIAVYNRSGLTIQRTIKEFVNDIFEYKGRREFKGKKGDRGEALLKDIISSSDNIINAMKLRLEKSAAEKTAKE